MERQTTFCARLRAARMAKGVSLEQIAASTKISVSLLKGLEGGDLSRWPKALYRRSYLRDYLRAVGLPVTSTVAEFARLFPDADDAAVDEHAYADEPEAPQLSLTLALTEDRADRFAEAGRRISAAIVDAMIVLMLSGTAALVLPADFGISIALVALVYYSIGTAAIGRTFGAQWIVHRDSKRWRKATVPASRHPFRERIHRLRDLSAAISRSTARDIVRMPWHALLLRIRFLR